MSINRVPTTGGHPASSSPEYPDVPLRLGSASMRLLSLHLDDSGIICGQLETFSISESPPFMALSYEWGAIHPVHDILLHGKEYSIRENLFNALHAILNYREKSVPNPEYPGDYLRDESGTTLHYIWIDSICIDQGNINERNHQVNLMKNIYSQASLVVAWLGMGDVATTKSMQHFHRYRATKLDSFRSRSRLTILDLGYFRRMWIVQEVTLSKRFVIMCGQQAIDGAVVRNWSQQNNSPRLPERIGGMWWSMQRPRVAKGGKSEKSFSRTRRTAIT